MSESELNRPNLGTSPQPDPHIRVVAHGSTLLLANFSMLTQVWWSTQVGSKMECMGAVRTTLTMDEFLELPELDAGKRELLNGELIYLPPAKFRHDQIAHRLLKRLNAALPACGVDGEAYVEIGYQLDPSHWLQPDVSITHPGQPVDGYLQGAPLLAVEIVSPSNTAVQIDAKIDAYLTHGAHEVWVLYPDAGHLWVYAPGISALRHDGPFSAAVLNGETIDLPAILA